MTNVPFPRLTDYQLEQVYRIADNEIQFIDQIRYPTFEILEKKGVIRRRWRDWRNYVVLTPLGKQLVEQSRSQWKRR